MLFPPAELTIVGRCRVNGGYGYSHGQLQTFRWHLLFTGLFLSAADVFYICQSLTSCRKLQLIRVTGKWIRWKLGGPHLAKPEHYIITVLFSGIASFTFNDCEYFGSIFCILWSVLHLNIRRTVVNGTNGFIVRPEEKSPWVCSVRPLELICSFYAKTFPVQSWWCLLYHLRLDWLRFSLLLVFHKKRHLFLSFIIYSNDDQFTLNLYQL